MNSHLKNKKISRHIDGLDSLRFILALIVMLSHLSVPWFSTLKQSSNLGLRLIGRFVPTLFCGTGAVIGFFIVSGFIIHYANKGHVLNTNKFLVKRVLRIAVPPLIITIIGYLFFGINAWLIMPLWSLYCEVIYYFLYPWLRKIKVVWKYQFLFSFLFAFVVIFFNDAHDITSLLHQQDLGYVVGGYGYMQFGDYITWIIGLPCWLLGVIMAEKIDSSQIQTSRKRIFLVRLILITITSVIVILNFKFYVSLMISMNLFALILYKWIFEEIIFFRTYRSISVLEVLGKASYSMYLLHGICIETTKKYLPVSNDTYLVFIFIPIVAAYIFYLLIEKPSHKFAQRIGEMLFIKESGALNRDMT